MFNLVDFPDMKYFRIHNETKNVAGVSTATWTHQAPPNRMCFLHSVRISGGTAMRVATDGFSVDDVVLSLLVPATIFANPSHIINPGPVRGESTTNANGMFMIPLRRKVVLTIDNQAAGAENITVEMFAYVHQDPQQRFLAEAGMQGG